MGVVGFWVKLQTNPDVSPGGVLQPRVCLALPPVGVPAVPLHVLHTSTFRVSSLGFRVWDLCWLRALCGPRFWNRVHWHQDRHV